MKPIKITIFTFIFLAIAVVGTECLFMRFIPDYDYARLPNFNRETVRYALSREEHKIVVIGPCYVNQLGPFDNPAMFNFGIGGFKQCEVLPMLDTYADTNDTIVYGLTIFQCCGLNRESREPRSFITASLPERWQYVVKNWGKAWLLGLYLQPLGDRKSQYNKKKISGKSFVKRCMTPKDSGKRLVQEIEDIRKKYPRLIVAMWPIEDAPEIKAAQANLKDLVIAAGIPAIDISNAIDNSEIHGYVHQTLKGSRLTRIALETSLAQD